MDQYHLEFAYMMLRLEQRMSKAATRISCIYRGLKTRRHLREVLKQRKKSTLFIQAIIRRRMLARKKLKRQNNAATLIQRYCKGHLVAKHYIHLLGDVSIDKSLFKFKVMKQEISMQLAKMIYFYWKIYKRNQERKKKAEEERKRKAKAAKKKKKGAQRNNSFAMKANQSIGRNSISSSKPSTSNLASSAKKKSTEKKTGGDEEQKVEDDTSE